MAVTSTNGGSRASDGVNGNRGIGEQSPSGEERDCYDVCIVGAGPAGLMLSVILARLGATIRVLDDRPDQTSAGRADGIQPKTIETFQMLGLGDELLRQGVKVYDICMWKATNEEDLHREGREVHYPKSVVDVLHPYILLCHQGMVESMFINDLGIRGISVCRSHGFKTYEKDHEGLLQISAATVSDGTQLVQSRYLVGCDGARSAVRRAIPGTHSQGSPHNSVWGVLDGELDTDFPDIWSKTLVFSEQHGSVLMIPRERNMTRFYIEMKNWESAKDLAQEFVMEQAKKVLKPCYIRWKSVEWFGNYAVSQRVAARFSDPELKAFIAGDASHSHSPKAAQGLNTSVHDSWNLGWKLNLSLRGLSRADVLLESYENERKKIAHDLINFDFEHANQVAGGDAKKLAENFRTNTRFISGVGVEYSPNALNYGPAVGFLRPGYRLPPSNANRFIDANPIDVQMDIPMLGQFRIYVLAPDLQQCSAFLAKLNQLLIRDTSFLSKMSRAAAKSYESKPRSYGLESPYDYAERYTSNSQLFTYALITSSEKRTFELATLPSLFSGSPWTVYVDNVASSSLESQSCTEKWLGKTGPSAVSVLNVRPDGYVGSVSQWEATVPGSAEKAAAWLETYYQGFLSA